MSAPGDRLGRRRVAVIGGGLGGLSAAFFLHERLGDAIEIELFERSSRLGGIVQTDRRVPGWLLECGPDSFIRTKPAGVDLCERLGIADDLIAPLPNHQRALIAAGDQLVPVPDDFHLLVPRRLTALLETPLLSTAAKLRLLREATLPPPATTATDESLADFTRRRWGPEVLSRLVQPLVAGIYSANPEELSLAATMPQFLQFERTFGSLTAAGRAQRDQTRVSGARYALFASFPDGMSRLTDALVDRLADVATLDRETAVCSVSRTSEPYGRWTVAFEDERSPSDFDAVVLAVPAAAAAQMLGDAAVGRSLREIRAASSAIVVTGHRVADVSHPLDAFGVVIPHAERQPATAISIASRKFPNRCPEGHCLLRTFVGSPQFDVETKTDAEIAAAAAAVRARYLGVCGQPVVETLTRYHGGSPQYRLRHLALVEQVEAAVKTSDGLGLVGASYRGVGIPDTIASAQATVDRLASSLGEPCPMASRAAAQP